LRQSPRGGPGGSVAAWSPRLPPLAREAGPPAGRHRRIVTSLAPGGRPGRAGSL